MTEKELIEYYREHPIAACEDLCDKELASFQKISLELAFKNKFCFWIMCRGGGKTFLLALYSILKAILYPKSTVILTAGVFRQAKRAFDEAESHIIDESKFLKSVVSKISHYTDQYTVYFNNKSKIIAIPLGKSSKEGEGAAGFHGHLVIDELWRVPSDTFDLILFPFLGTSKNPIQRMKLKKEYGKKKAEELDNSLLCASTSYYQFNHLYKRWQDHLKKIKAADDFEVLIPERAMQGNNRAAVNFRWCDLPDGFLDEEMIEEAKENPIVFRIMYENEFPSDSDGPFKQSILDNLRWVAPYYPKLEGDPDKEYVIGVDPARTSDYFAMVVIEIGSPHKIVYVSAKQRLSFQNMAMRIRKLTFRFKNVVSVVMDKGGGGLAIKDLLAEKIFTDENDIIKDPIVEKDSEISEGLHILELKQVDNPWMDQVNASILGSFQAGRLLLPVDEIDYSGINPNQIPLYEAVLKNIEKLIHQFVSIRIKSTAGGAPRWDTSNEKAKKDIYSAALFAYWGLRSYMGEVEREKQRDFTKRKKYLPRVKIYRTFPFDKALSYV